MSYFAFQTPSTEAEWLAISQQFQTIWNMPNCLGSVDGKHFRIVRPPCTGSLYYNYKHYYSIIMMAVSDAQYRFLYMDVGAEGKASDGGVWARTKLQKDMNDPTNPVNIPPARALEGVDGAVPHFIVGDDAFPLRPNLMKPYPQTNLTLRQRVYNYRLSRCRRVIENAFGILTTKFRLFRQELTMYPESSEVLIGAAVVLHNMLREKCGRNYIPPGLVDAEDEQHNVIEGHWRQEGPLDRMDSRQPRRPSYEAKEIRNKLALHFVHPAGEVAWQYSKL